MLLPNSQELISIKIPTSGVVNNKLISEIILPYGSSIVLVIDIDGKNKEINDSTKILSGDEVILIVNLNAINEVWNLLTELR
jgi:Trk K+ transport system NAD-binding subunit